MNRFVFLDAGPLGLATKGTKGDHCRAWIHKVRRVGWIVVVPEIADYEIRRELIRTGPQAADMLVRLDGLVHTLLYLPLTTPSMRRAALLWASLRNAGQSTADPKAIDADAILAAQALTAISPGDEFVIATTNVGHLGRFPGVKASPWELVS